MAILLLNVTLARDVESVPPDAFMAEATGIALADAMTNSPPRTFVDPP
jgi:hypothetical protein